MRFLALFREFSDISGVQKIAIFRGSAKKVIFVLKKVPHDPRDPFGANTRLGKGTACHP